MLISQSINQSSDIHYGACGRGSVKLTQIKRVRHRALYIITTRLKAFECYVQCSICRGKGVGGSTPLSGASQLPKLTLTPH